MVSIDAQDNRVVIGKQADLARRGLVADQINWLSPVRDQPFSCLAQIRYNSTPHPATCTVNTDGTLHIEFHQPCPGVAPGQAVVCYEGDRVLVGGWIRESLR